MIRAPITLIALAGAMWTGCNAAGGTNARSPQYKVFAVSYGVLPHFPVAGLVAGADTSRRLDIEMMVWVLVGPEGRRILVDAGFFRAKFFDRWTVRDFVRPSDALAVLDLQPTDITDIIVTHLHWDHAGGVELFPGAHVWVQADEWTYYRERVADTLALGVDPEDLAVLERRRAAGRLTLVDGDAREVLPGVTVYTGGRHTRASQYVGVATAAGTVVLASDNVYLYENLDKRVPIAQTWDAESNLRAQARMNTVASLPRLIVPGHDPEVLSRFQLVGPRAVKIE